MFPYFRLPEQNRLERQDTHSKQKIAKTRAREEKILAFYFLHYCIQKLSLVFVNDFPFLCGQNKDKIREELVFNFKTEKTMDFIKYVFCHKYL